MKATLEKGPTERWLIGSNDVAVLPGRFVQQSAAFEMPRRPLSVSTLRRDASGAVGLQVLRGVGSCVLGKEGGSNDQGEAKRRISRLGS